MLVLSPAFVNVSIHEGQDEHTLCDPPKAICPTLRVMTPCVFLEDQGHGVHLACLRPQTVGSVAAKTVDSLSKDAEMGVGASPAEPRPMIFE